MSIAIHNCSNATEGFPSPLPNTPPNVLEQLRLTGAVVVITGAADGISFAVAEAMAEAGAHIAMRYNSDTVSLSKRRALLVRAGVADMRKDQPHFAARSAIRLI